MSETKQIKLLTFECIKKQTQNTTDKINESKKDLFNYLNIKKI